MNWGLGKRNLLEQRSWSETSDQDLGPDTAAILNIWLDSLPSSAYGILDMAAGQGFESRYMSQLGNKVTAYDNSDYMASNAVYQVNYGNMTSIKLPRNSFSGVLVKDAWVFLDDFERSQALDLFYSSLVRGGSTLILSQSSDTRAHIIPNESQLPIKVLLSDFRSRDEWSDYVLRNTNEGGQVLSIEYQTDKESFVRESKKAGFKLDLTGYSYNSNYSQENRWLPGRNQWVAKLIK